MRSDSTDRCQQICSYSGFFDQAPDIIIERNSDMSFDKHFVQLWSSTPNQTLSTSEAQKTVIMPI